MRDMHFITATNKLTAGPTLVDLAREMGLHPQTLRQARLDPSASSYRRPPDGWEKAVAKLARRRAVELLKLADTLDPGE